MGSSMYTLYAITSHQLMLNLVATPLNIFILSNAKVLLYLLLAYFVLDLGKREFLILKRSFFRLGYVPPSKRVFTYPGA